MSWTGIVSGRERTERIQDVFLKAESVEFID